MAPKPPPPPPPRKNFFQRLDSYLDTDQGRERSAILVLLFFILAVVMTYLYMGELKKDVNLLKAVASIRQFAVEYDASLSGKTDLEVLAGVHLLILHLLNLTIMNEELDRELEILTQLLPEWQVFEKNLYYFSTVRKTWNDSRDDCLSRHTADLVTCKLGEEQGFIDEMVTKNNKDYWIGLVKNSTVDGGVLWINGVRPKETFWHGDQPDGGSTETCIVAIPPCTLKNCWHDAPCSESRYFCCKIAPERRWMQ